MSYPDPGPELVLDTGFYLPPELANLPGAGPLVLGMVWQLPWFNDADQMLEATHRFIATSLGATSCYLCQLGALNAAGQRLLRHPDGPGMPAVFSATDSALAAWSRTKDSRTLEITGAASSATLTPAESGVLAELSCFAPALLFPLRSGTEPTGWLLVGGKTSGDVRNWLEVLVRNVNHALGRLELAADLELLGRVSRGLAHDLAGFLTPVSVFLQLSAGGEPFAAKARALLPTALANFAQAQTVLRHAVGYSQGRVAQWGEVRLRPVVEQAVTAITAQAREKSISLPVGIADPAKVIGDEVLILRLLVNLLANAVSASPAGREVKIEVLPTGDGFLAMRILDEGPGLPPGAETGSALPIRTDPASSAKIPGLGLAICHRIVHWHGGTLTFQARPGGGTIAEVRVRAA